LFALALVLLAGGVGAYLLLLALLPSAVIYTPNSRGGPSPASASTVPRDVRAIRVTVGPPPASLSCWVLDPSRGHSHATVLVLHGIRDSAWSQLGVGRTLARRGYRAVLVDLRGHGQSSGKWLTYGVVEARDLSRVLDALHAQDLLVGAVGVAGFSYGGAVALQLAGRDPRISAVASVDTFTSLHDVVPLYVRRIVPLLGRLITRRQIDDALARAGRTAGFDPRQASPLLALPHTRAAVLLIHGTADRHIPPSHARALFAAAPAARRRLVLIAGADHDGALGHPRTAQAITDWFRRWLGPAAR